jgi:hypothetical protein
MLFLLSGMPPFLGASVLDSLIVCLRWRVPRPSVWHFQGEVVLGSVVLLAQQLSTGVGLSDSQTHCSTMAGCVLSPL